MEHLADGVGYFYVRFKMQVHLFYCSKSFEAPEKNFKKNKSLRALENKRGDYQMLETEFFRKLRAYGMAFFTEKQEKKKNINSLK